MMNTIWTEMYEKKILAESIVNSLVTDVLGSAAEEAERAMRAKNMQKMDGWPIKLNIAQPTQKQGNGRGGNRQKGDGRNGPRHSDKGRHDRRRDDYRDDRRGMKRGARSPYRRGVEEGRTQPDPTYAKVLASDPPAHKRHRA